MNTTTVPPSYINQCVGQFQALADKGHILLAISILLAASFAFLSLVQLVITVGVSLEALRSGANRQKMAEAGGADATPIPGILDSVKGLIGALSGAPAWFAVFLAGLALIWMATLFTPAKCFPLPPAPTPVDSDITRNPTDQTKLVPKVQQVEKPKKTPGSNSEAGGR